MNRSSQMSTRVKYCVFFSATAFFIFIGATLKSEKGKVDTVAIGVDSRGKNLFEANESGAQVLDHAKVRHGKFKKVATLPPNFFWSGKKFSVTSKGEFQSQLLEASPETIKKFLNKKKGNQ